MCSLSISVFFTFYATVSIFFKLYDLNIPSFQQTNIKSINMSTLPDKGQRLLSRVEAIQKDIQELDAKIKVMRSHEGIYSFISETQMIINDKFKEIQ